jgi:hypothetical protein
MIIYLFILLFFKGMEFWITRQSKETIAMWQYKYTINISRYQNEHWIYIEMHLIIWLKLLWDEVLFLSINCFQQLIYIYIHEEFVRNQMYWSCYITLFISVFHLYVPFLLQKPVMKWALQLILHLIGLSLWHAQILFRACW